MSQVGIKTCEVCRGFVCFYLRLVINTFHCLYLDQAPMGIHIGHLSATTSNFETLHQGHLSNSNDEEIPNISRRESPQIEMSERDEK